jgi:hypothetical protein
MYHIKLIYIKKNSIQRGFFKKSTVLPIFISLFFFFILTSDFKSKGFLITLTISHDRICPDSVVSNALLPLHCILIILWLVRARYETFLHTYVHTGSIPDVGRPFLPHLPPPSSLNVCFSVLKTGKLLLIPNSAPSGSSLLDFHLYQILCSDHIQSA